MSTSRLIVLILTFVCFLVWFSADLIRTKPSVVNSPELEQALEPIDPTFNQETLSKIQNLKQNIPQPSLKPATSSAVINQ